MSIYLRMSYESVVIILANATMWVPYPQLMSVTRSPREGTRWGTGCLPRTPGTPNILEAASPIIHKEPSSVRTAKAEPRWPPPQATLVTRRSLSSAGAMSLGWCPTRAPHTKSSPSVVMAAEMLWPAAICENSAGLSLKRPGGETRGVEA
jgi:hypothetical protein